MILLVIAILLVWLWKNKGKKSIIFFLVFLLITNTVFFIWKNWPIVYAVKEDEFNQYSNYILVREVHYTGTGWIMVGDETGYLPGEQTKDIVLKGKRLPEAQFPENFNTFLCVIEY